MFPTPAKNRGKKNADAKKNAGKLKTHQKVHCKWNSLLPCTLKSFILLVFEKFFPIDCENLQKPFFVKGSRENEKTGKLQKKCTNKEMAEINHVCIFFLFFENLCLDLGQELCFLFFAWFFLPGQSPGKKKPGKKKTSCSKHFFYTKKRKKTGIFET
jgi:hypothetical protein